MGGYAISLTRPWSSVALVSQCGSKNYVRRRQSISLYARKDQEPVVIRDITATPEYSRSPPYIILDDSLSTSSPSHPKP
jgi:hypothetical protein